MRLARVSTRLRRWRWLVAGQVQGVGFRPFLHRGATQLGLTGFVRNGPDGVIIECQGELPALRDFDARLRGSPPPLARIRKVVREDIDAVADDAAFQILQSAQPDERATPGADVTVDAATCPRCREEILSPSDRRHRYGLTNCTQCGPRYSIIRQIPYDRCNTTMAGFEMCPKCRAEYASIADRRFHAQPIACPDCGPQVSLVNPSGDAITSDPIETARRMLLAGQILAIKGIGGFNLAVRADDEQAVQRLRWLKRRDFKPFALMAATIEDALRLAEFSDSAKSLMQSPACPIVLGIRRDGAKVAAAVAPGSHRLGVMLPYTPIHLLLLDGLPPLVMTSGNVSDEPLAIDNDEALARLGPLCDGLLWHDRPIQRGIDDSVVIDLGVGEPIPVRRARGFVPRAIELPVTSQSSGICVGGELKATVAVVRNGQAILSQHLGDLTHPRAFEACVRAIDDLLNLFAIRPDWVAHDMHPTYVSTGLAAKLAQRFGVPQIPVQHHHAHAASLLAEHGMTGPMLAIVCDGTGYGADGTIWGGELLRTDLRGFRRLAHLRPLQLAGGDAAARDTRRCALAMMHHALPDPAEHSAAGRILPDADRRQFLSRMIRGGVSCAASSGAGRYFDGAAALLGLCEFNHHEAQAAQALEAAAHRALGAVLPYESQPLFSVTGDDARQIDFAPLIQHLCERGGESEATPELALEFHEQFAQAWASVTLEAAREHGIDAVGISGGVFCNAILTTRVTELLVAQGLRVLRHRVVPPNDGGLSLGQAAVAAARMTG